MGKAAILFAAMLVTSWSGGAAAQRSLTDEQRRLVVARREATAAAMRARQLAAAASTEHRAAERARADEAALAARVTAAAADLVAARARAALVAALLADQRRHLAERQAPAARLLGALASMARRPAAAALAQPGSVADLVHVRAVLGGALPVVRARTAGLRADLDRTRRLQAVAVLATAALRDGQARLERDRTALALLEARHRARAGVLGRSALSEADRALALGERARDLVDRLGQEGRATATAAGLATLAGPVPPPSPAVTARLRGVYRLPAAGRLVVGLGEISPAGVRSRGLTLAVAAGAPVVAPAAGTVRYAGRFRRYAGIVILDHGDGWTSLVTGLDAIGVRVGDVVAIGQPLGAAGRGDDPRITVELRRRGEPIDAAALIG